MLNKPKFMTPSTNMQECTIDFSEKNIPFSCIIDGNEAIQAWQIIIYNLTDGVKVFDSEKVMLSCPFYPVDEKNRNVVFKINLKDHLDDNAILVNRKEAYCWTITFWGTSDNSVKSCEEVFYASAKPSVSIFYKEHEEGEYLPFSENTVLQSRTCFFKGVYSSKHNEQNGNIEYVAPLKRYGWRLCDTDSGQVLMDTISNNQIYGVADNIACSYNGFLNNGKYSIEVYVETQDNTTIITKPINFNISYSTTFLNNDFKVETLRNEPAIILDWHEAIVIGGRNEGEIAFKQNYPIIDYSTDNPITSVKIPPKSSVVFDYGSSSNLDVDENCYIVLSTQLSSGDDTILFYAEGKDEHGFELLRKLTFSNGRFDYVVKDNSESIAIASYPDSSQGFEIRPNKYLWYVIVMSPMLTDDSGECYVELSVVESRLINGLYPSESVYPSSGLYPTSGVWNKLKEVE